MLIFNIATGKDQNSKTVLDSANKKMIDCWKRPLGTICNLFGWI